MRIALAGFSLESVSFLAAETTVAEFQRSETCGNVLLEQLRGTNTVMGGFIEVCEAEDYEIVPIVHTEAGARGPASDEAFEHYLALIVAGLRAEASQLDGVLLNLHGAATTPTRTDPDREMVAAVRAAIGPDKPMMLALDYHGNLDGETIQGATASFGYHYSPHTDMGETGRRAGRCLARTLKGEVRPTWALAKPNLMIPSILSATSLQPLNAIVERSLALSKEDTRIIDVSVFAGFSYADVPNCGFSVVAVTNDDPDLAKRIVDDLAGQIHSLRRELHQAATVYELVDGVALAIEKARTAKKPIVLLEHADRMNDSTYVLRELIRQDAKDVAVPFLWDPSAAAEAVTAGEGATIRLDVGGRSSPRAGGPVTIEGRVCFAGEKDFLIGGPMNHGNHVRLGPTAIIDTGKIVISLVTNPYWAIDEDAFVQFGMRAADFKIIVLRSKTHFRAVYEPLSEEIMIIDTPDWGPADLRTLPYQHIPRAYTYPFIEAD